MEIDETRARKEKKGREKADRTKREREMERRAVFITRKSFVRKPKRKYTQPATFIFVKGNKS